MKKFFSSAIFLFSKKYVLITAFVIYVLFCKSIFKLDLLVYYIYDTNNKLLLTNLLNYYSFTHRY